jgi:hypothetical protein
VAGADDFCVAVRDGALEGRRLLPAPVSKPWLLLAPAKKEADEEASEKKLGRRGQTTTPVPVVEAMAGEELAPGRPREPKDVLDVRRRSSERSADGRIERAAHCGEEQHAADARADLEAAVGDVLVRHPIPCEVEQ